MQTCLRGTLSKIALSAVSAVLRTAQHLHGLCQTQGCHKQSIRTGPAGNAWMQTLRSWAYAHTGRECPHRIAACLL